MDVKATKLSHPIAQIGDLGQNLALSIFKTSDPVLKNLHIPISFFKPTASLDSTGEQIHLAYNMSTVNIIRNLNIINTQRELCLKFVSIKMIINISHINSKTSTENSLSKL